MKNIKIVVFDCDGVLFDTTKVNLTYYNQILERFGMPVMTPEQLKYVHMHTVDEAFSYLFEDERIRQEALDHRKTISYVPFIQFMKIEPYLKSLLKKIRPTYKTAIATNRTDTMANILHEYGLEKCFDMVVTSLDVDRPKPNPDQLVKILEYFRIKPYQAIYVGDSELDEIAANAAGVPLIAYKNRFLSTNIHISSLKEIEDILGL